MQAPPTRFPLMPWIESSLNVKPDTASTSRKRKRDDMRQDHTFTAKSLEPRRKHSAFTFAPVTIIPRSNLPLVWLAPASEHKTLPSGSLLEASIPRLDDTANTVLIARRLPNGGLYAIEKGNEKSWVAFGLSNWLTEEHCKDAAKGLSKLLPEDATVSSRSTHARSDSQTSNPSGRPLTPSSPKKPKNHRGALARISILGSRESQDQPQPIQSRSPTLVQFPQALPSKPNDLSSFFETQLGSLGTIVPSEEHTMSLAMPESPREGNVEPRIPTAELRASEEQRRDQLSYEHIVHQYLDTLYLSKTSLAFFAKGPLSRARAQANSETVTIDTQQLAEIYRDCILPGKKSDTKYKESLPNFIESLSAPNESGNEAKQKKKRAPKKLKLGKDCLYTCEYGVVEKWWRDRDFIGSAVISANSLTEEMKKATSDLRTRETQMQLLLILEVLLLDATPSKIAKSTNETGDSTVKLESIEQDPVKIIVMTAKAKKKPRDLKSELDAIVDKLCIWHTVSLDGLLNSPEKTRESSIGPATESKDRLREFCTDVIIPFYGAKLPEQTKSLCKKLGVPEISPHRPRSKAIKSSSHRKPEPVSKSKPRPTMKRTLERVLSEDQSLLHFVPPVLSRSSTAPLLQAHRRTPSMTSIKREPSDLPTRPLSRPGLQKSVSFVGREIDLVADAKVYEAKKRKLDKLTTQKKELDAAIDALKKPNRSNVGREIMNEVEQRKLVQITATPSRKKARQLLKDVSLSIEDEAEVPPEDLDPVIPSSTIKPMLVPTIPRSSLKKRAVLAAISDTPSRGTMKLSNPLKLSAVPALASDTVASTPATRRLRPDLPPPPTDTPLPTTKRSSKPVLFTPLKRSDVSIADSFRDAPVIPEEAGKAMDRVMGGKGMSEQIEMSTNIYEQLGWDEDDGDL